VTEEKNTDWYPRIFENFPLKQPNLASDFKGSSPTSPSQP